MDEIKIREAGNALQLRAQVDILDIILSVKHEDDQVFKTVIQNLRDMLANELHAKNNPFWKEK